MDSTTRRVALAAMIALAATLGASGALAQTTAARTFVSGLGSDANPCSRTQPCRGFARAISQTSAGGEVIVLDSAGYGAFTISGPISISATGVDAAISVTSGDGITINAGAGDVVNLRGLAITGTSGANNGITFNSGGTLNIQNCIARGFSNDGIYLAPTNAATVNIFDTIASNNGFFGIYFGPSTSGSAFFERVQAVGNGIGIEADGQHVPDGATVNAIAVKSLGASNTFDGFAAFNPNAILTVVRSLAYGNVRAGFNAEYGKLIVAQSKSIANKYGFATIGSGSIMTFGDNDLVDGRQGTVTPIGQQ